MACNSEVLPPVNFSLCDPVTQYGEMKRVLMTRDTSADVVASPATIGSWTSRIENADPIPGSGAAPIRMLDGIGSLSEAEQTETRRSLGRKTYSTPIHTLPFRVDDVSLENLAMVKAIQENPGVKYKCWFVAPGFLIGAGTGVSCNVKAAHIIPESNTELQYIQLTFSFEGVLPTIIADPGLATLEL